MVTSLLSHEHLTLFCKRFESCGNMDAVPFHVKVICQRIPTHQGCASTHANTRLNARSLEHGDSLTGTSQPCIGVFTARYDSIAPGMHRVRYPSLQHRLCETASQSHVCFPLCVPSTSAAASVQEPRAEVVCLRGERAGALRLVQEDGKHRVFELGPLVFDALAYGGLRKSIALRRL